MANVIIAIHGLRNKPPKKLLEQWAHMSINEGLDNLNLNIELPKFELVYWADIIYDKPLSLEETNPKSPYFIDEVYTPAPKKHKRDKHLFRRKMILILKKIIYFIFLDSRYKLRFSFISKNFIHYNFKDLEIYFSENCGKEQSEGCVKKDRINNRLLEVLRKYKNDRILFIAHSMGSIIAFDVLSLYGHELKVDTFATMGAPLGAPFVISRIAKLTNTHTQEYIKLQTPESVTNRWVNFADITDNIAMDYKLSDDFAANSKGVKVQDFLVINNYKMNGKANPHKSFGYLRTPEFIQVLHDFIKNGQ